jgi:glucose-6-phosphate 1-dehydrogenase
LKLASLQTRVQERFCVETRPDPCGLAVFGASGDLAERKLFPSLFNLHRSGLLPSAFFVAGVGRTPLTDDAFRARVEAAVLARARPLPSAPGETPVPPPSAADARAFAARFRYLSGDYADPALHRRLGALLAEEDRAHGTRGNRLYYLSVPPSVFGPAVAALGEAGLSRQRAEGLGWARLVIEKPFGRDLASARELTALVRKSFDEEQTYRIDHYLGKETVQSILVLRFANILFEPVWNREYVDHVQITAAEELGVGHRAGYYEQAGVLRDMFQNHLLQLLCVTAMEPPASFDAERVRDEKAAVLRAVPPIDFGSAVRGQYGPGAVDGAAVPGYRQEPGVAPDSRTDTFAALRLSVDNPRWRGVPFYLRSGKRLPRRATEIAVQFKHVPRLLFHPLRPEDLAANLLVLRIQPEEGICLRFETKHPGPKLCMSSVSMDFNYESSFGEPPEAYERLFLDCMAGDRTLFLRSDSVDLSWSLLDPLVRHWDAAPPPELYPAGSEGPVAAATLLTRDGRSWREASLADEPTAPGA